jgi:hypothetical protein
MLHMLLHFGLITLNTQGAKRVLILPERDDVTCTAGLRATDTFQVVLLECSY